eukprot:symbB.v1.2.014708.t1/scaffold1080.1/size139481/4
MGKRGKGHSVKPSETVLKAGAGREVSKSSKCIPVSVKVAQLRETGYDNFETWLKDPKNLYVGRRGRIFIHANGSKRIFHYAASKWQNPFVVSKNLSREMACEKFRAALLNGSLKDHEDGRPLHEKLVQLRGLRLGCWCKPEACHADILAELANASGVGTSKS